MAMQHRLGGENQARLRFLEHQEVPETKRHLQLRTALFQILELLVGDRAAVGSEQFVYWDPTDPRQCLAPDAFVRMDSPNDSFRTWKVWERGAPHLAVEIVSDSDQGETDWQSKFDSYCRLGVEELVRFDPDAGGELRIWDLRDGVLTERDVASEGGRSRMVPGYWVVTDDAEGPTLRLAADAKGDRLFPTPNEAREREAEAREREAEAREREAEAREREVEARERAERLEREQRARADRLEAELQKLQDELRRR